MRLEKADTLKELAGPFYVKSDSKHAFSELLKKVDNAKTLVGPVYMDGDVKHHYNELQKQAENIRRYLNRLKASNNYLVQSTYQVTPNQTIMKSSKLLCHSKISMDPYM